MSSSASSQIPDRSFGQWIVTAIFGLLAVAFLFRGAQFTYKWLRHVVEGDTNFKVLTCWSLVYFAVCGGIAAVAYFLPREDEASATQPE